MTRRALLDGKSLATLDAVYEALGRQLAFPPHFGRNLDALWDVLTTDIPGPIEIVWCDAAQSRSALGKEFERVLDVLRRAAAARGDIVVTLEE